MNGGEYLLAALVTAVVYAWVALVACRVRWGMGRQDDPRIGLAAFLVGQLFGTIVSLAMVAFAAAWVVSR